MILENEKIKKNDLWKMIKFKLSLYRPISKGEMLEHRYELALLTGYVKELEAINRNDIMMLIKKMDDFTGRKKPGKNKKDKYNKEMLIYQ